VIFKQYSTVISTTELISKISKYSHYIYRSETLKKYHWLAYTTASVQSAQTEPWSLCTPLFDQLIHNALL